MFYILFEGADITSARTSPAPKNAGTTARAHAVQSALNRSIVVTGAESGINAVGSGQAIFAAGGFDAESRRDDIWRPPKA
ncbi:MAG: hypothetical protein ACTH08_12485 [Brevibacterium yomogidense]